MDRQHMEEIRLAGNKKQRTQQTPLIKEME
jgi:hypothetical protein